MFDFAPYLQMQSIQSSDAAILVQYVNNIAPLADKQIPQDAGVDPPRLTDESIPEFKLPSDMHIFFH